MIQLKRCLIAIMMCLAVGLSAVAQTADEIIQKHITAIGGAENWRKIRSIKMIGSVNAGGQELPITVTVLQGKGFKAEYSFSGMSGYSIITDKAGWNYAPFGGQTKPEAVPAETVKQLQDQLDIQGPLIDYAVKGHKVAYLGKDEVEGTECHKIKVTLANGKEETIFIDASSYYHVRSVEKVVANGKELEQTTTYGNYQKLPEGIVYAMSIDSGNGPISIKTVEINKPIDPDFFKPAEETKK